MIKLLMTALLGLSLFAIDQPSKIPPGSKVFIQPIEGFTSYLIAAINKKKVPLVVVADQEKADFVIGGSAESQKAGWAKMLVLGSRQSAEEASINVVNVKSGEVVFAYNVNKGNSARGKQSSAEACAKHLGKAVLGKE